MRISFKLCHFLWHINERSHESSLRSEIANHILARARVSINSYPSHKWDSMHKIYQTTILIKRYEKNWRLDAIKRNGKWCIRTTIGIGNTRALNSKCASQQHSFTNACLQRELLTSLSIITSAHVTHKWTTATRVLSFQAHRMQQAFQHKNLVLLCILYAWLSLDHGLTFSLAHSVNNPGLTSIPLLFVSHWPLRAQDLHGPSLPHKTV